jgi:polyisoprenoid-binding protein YceI
MKSICGHRAIWPILMALLMALYPAVAGAYPAKYFLDQRYATIQFTTSGLFNTQGYFRHFKGNLAIDLENLQNSAITVVIDDSVIDMPWASGISTLKSPAYFDSDKFPKITFRSISIRRESKAHYKIDGALTIRGITRDQVMEATLIDVPSGIQTPSAADFIVTGSLHRSEFGMVADRSVVSDAISLTIHARLALGKAG